MRSFARVKSLASTKEFKAGAVLFNKLAQTLAEFQVLWHTSWLKAVDTAAASLQNNLLTIHPETGSRPFS